MSAYPFAESKKFLISNKQTSPMVGGNHELNLSFPSNDEESPNKDETSVCSSYRNTHNIQGFLNDLSHCSNFNFNQSLMVADEPQKVYTDHKYSPSFTQSNQQEVCKIKNVVFNDFQILYKNREAFEIQLLHKDAIYIPRLILSKEFSKIEQLDISSNKIIELEGRIFVTLKNLKVFNAAHNEIKYVSSKISECSNLEELQLDHNKIEMLPSEIHTLSKLRTLSLSHNCLKVLTHSLVDLTSLEVLNVSNNLLKNLPKGIKNWQRLSQIQLHKNKLRSIPAEFHYFPSLRTFSLDWFQYCKPQMKVVFSYPTEEGFEDLKVMQQITIDQIKRMQNCCATYEMESGQVSFLQFLTHVSLESFDIDQQDNRGRTILHNAAYRNEQTILTLLIEAGADPNILDKDRYSPLGIALREDNFRCAQKLLKHPLVEVDKGAGQICSMLHLAVVKQEVGLVEMIIERGADTNAKEIDTGDTPVHLLMNVFTKNSLHSRQILDLLAQNGADLNMKNFDNLTPLHIAAKRGNFDACESLLKIKNYEGFENKVDFDAQGGQEMWTPLHIAAFGSYYRIVSLLTEKGADMFLRNKQGKTPMTSITNNLLMIKLLKKYEISTIMRLLSNPNSVKEANLINIDLIQQSILSFGSKRRIRYLFSQHTFRDSLVLIGKSILYPEVIDQNRQPKATLVYHKSPTKYCSKDNYKTSVPTIEEDDLVLKHTLTIEDMGETQAIKNQTIIKQFESPQFNIHGFFSERLQPICKDSPTKITKQEPDDIPQRQTSGTMTHHNIFFVKETITSNAFQAKSIQFQMKQISQFKVLFNVRNPKHLSAFVEILNKLHHLNNDYIIEELLDFAQMVMNTTNLQDWSTVKHSLIKQSLTANSEIQAKIKDLIHCTEKHPIEVKLHLNTDHNLASSLLSSSPIFRNSNQQSFKNPFKKMSVSLLPNQNQKDDSQSLRLPTQQSSNIHTTTLHASSFYPPLTTKRRSKHPSEYLHHSNRSQYVINLSASRKLFQSPPYKKEMHSREIFEETKVDPLFARAQTVFKVKQQRESPYKDDSVVRVSELRIASPSKYDDIPLYEVGNIGINKHGSNQFLSQAFSMIKVSGEKKSPSRNPYCQIDCPKTPSSP